MIQGYSQAALEQAAADLSLKLTWPCVIALWGPFGAGKTTFARALIRKLLNASCDVPSPTFTLINPYETEKGTIYHCDLYRLTHPAQVEEIGLLEAFSSALCIIEWPQRLESYLPKKRINIYLDVLDSTHRSLRIEQ